MIYTTGIKEDMANKKERARQYYEQCQKAYDEFLTIPHAKTILSMDGQGIDIPDHFYDPFNVPAELLYQEVRFGAASDGDRMDFDNKLLLMMHKKQEFDPEKLGQKTKGRDRRLLKTYDVYFEVFYRQSNKAKPLLATKLTLGNVTFRQCSKRTLKNHVDAMERGENTPVGLYHMRRNEHFSLGVNDRMNESCLHPIKATVDALNEIEATDIAASKFSDYLACINVLQIRGSRNYTAFSTEPTTKHKTCIASTDVYLTKSPESDVEMLVDTTRQALPKNDLKITDNTNKMKQLKKLLRAFNDNTAAAKRLRFVTLELAQAIDTDNPNLRQLSYWRCLEITTAISNGESRKESDIVKIFQNYNPNMKYWHQMGESVKKLRNTYVHRGVAASSLSQHHLNWSQQYAECAFGILMYLYDHRSTWKTADDIDVFFDSYSKSDEVLILSGKLLAERRRSRSKSLGIAVE